MRDWMTLEICAAKTLGRPVVAAPRQPRVDDADALGEVMLNAYRGTVDDEGETLDDARREMRRVFEGGYGAFDAEASSVFVMQERLCAATLITRDATAQATGEAFVVFSMTAPDVQRSGLARAGLEKAIATLRVRGESRLHLVVTRANTPALRLYQSVGFRVIGSR